MSEVEESTVSYIFQQRSLRAIPEYLSENDKHEFLKISRRAAEEAVRVYSVVSLGLDSNFEESKLEMNIME
tara:strand:+ start:1174 stop:1386 length:213 start_codon:yes stop_codon:yes gene_type:complete